MFKVVVFLQSHNAAVRRAVVNLMRVSAFRSVDNSILHWQTVASKPRPDLPATATCVSVANSTPTNSRQPQSQNWSHNPSSLVTLHRMSNASWVIFVSAILSAYMVILECLWLIFFPEVFSRYSCILRIILGVRITFDPKVHLP